MKSDVTSIRFICGAILLWSAQSIAGSYTNHAGIEFLNIPGGRILIGSKQCTDNPQTPSESDKRWLRLSVAPVPKCSNKPNESWLSRPNEGPPHSVIIKSFQMSMTEVTVKQYRGAGLPIRSEHDSENEPVANVSWHEAKAFTEWLNKTKPIDDTGTYRLPSEAEWEYAARSGHSHLGKARKLLDGCYDELMTTPRRFVDKNDLLKKIPTVTLQANRKRSQFMPVATKKPNGFGLYDMLGNVSEWNEDCYHPSYKGAPSDGKPWVTGCEKTNTRVIRGGANDASRYLFCNPTARGQAIPDLIDTIGIRLVREVVQESNKQKLQP